MKKLRIVNTSNNELPTYATKGSAGMDLRANLQEDVVIAPGERKLISTGLKISLPVGYEAQIRPRSGLALKKGVTVLNSPGTVDSDYIGDIGVILINHGEDNFTVANGDRIAQMVIAKHEVVEFEQVERLEETERGSGGFGSTGKA